MASRHQSMTSNEGFRCFRMLWLAWQSRTFASIGCLCACQRLISLALSHLGIVYVLLANITSQAKYHGVQSARLSRMVDYKITSPNTSCSWNLVVNILHTMYQTNDCSLNCYSCPLPLVM